MSGLVDVLAVPMVLPSCEQHGQMELQSPGTPEQAYCGTWYRCTRCGSSKLFTSPALQRDLDHAALANVGSAS